MFCGKEKCLNIWGQTGKDGGQLVSLQGARAIEQHLQKLFEHKGYPLIVWPLECEQKMFAWFLYCSPSINYQ